VIQRRTKDIFNDHCQAGFDPSGLQRDATDMTNRNGYTPRCTRVFEKFHVTRAQVWKCPLQYKKEHCSPSIQPPEVVSGKR